MHINHERALLQQVAEGNTDAFRALFHAHQQKIGTFVLGWTKSLPLAEEIVQDVFLKVWLNKEILPTIDRFEAYLYTIARNQSFNALKQAARERIKAKEWAAAFELEQEDNDQLSEQYLPIIEKAIQQLPQQQQKVYLLKKQQGLKYEEIAAQMNISPETARKHLAAALKNITRFVQDYQVVLTIICSTPFIIS